ncbi:MAG: hypothetical protein ACI8TQ_003267, partial [Planctomycetota bacterium]
DLGFIQVFKEEYASDSLSMDFTVYGLGFGVQVSPVHNELSDTVLLTLPMRAGVNAATGQFGRSDDEPFLSFADLEYELGLSLRARRLQTYLGFYGVTFEGNTQSFGTNEFESFRGTEIRGSNFAPFAEVAFLGKDFLPFARCRVLGGDVQGVMFSIGLSH